MNHGILRLRNQLPLQESLKNCPEAYVFSSTISENLLQFYVNFVDEHQCLSQGSVKDSVLCL